jgi:hypothetical protein
MNKWTVTVDLNAPEGWDSTEVLDAVRWAIEDDPTTYETKITSLKVEPDDRPGRGRRLPAHYIEPDCDPTTGICHYGKAD